MTKTKSFHLHPGEKIKLKAGSSSSVKWSKLKSSASEIRTSEKGAKLTKSEVSSQNLVVKSVTKKETSQDITATVNGKAYKCKIYYHGYISLNGPESFFTNTDTTYYIGGIGEKEAIKTEWIVGGRFNKNDKHVPEKKDNYTLVLNEGKGNGHVVVAYKKMTLSEYHEWYRETYGFRFGASDRHYICPYADCEENDDGINVAQENEEGWLVAEGNVFDKIKYSHWIGRCMLESPKTQITTYYGY